MTLIRRLALLALPALLAFLAAPGRAAAQYGATPVSSGARVKSGFGGGGSEVEGGPKTRTPGLKLGNARFHGQLTLEFGYDSNVYYSAGSGDTASTAPVAPGEDEVGSVYMGVKPSFSLDNMPQTEKDSMPKFVYNVVLGYSYRRYLQELAIERDRNFHEANASVFLHAFPEGKVSFDVHETFYRTSQPRYGLSDENFDRDMNVVGAGVSYRPGGGLLDFRLGYRFVFDFYEAGDLAGANYYYHQPEFRAKWKFFPKTSFWLGVTWQFITYPDAFESAGVRGQNQGSRPIRVMTGVTGQFTPKLSFNAGIGYAYSWYEKPADRPVEQYNLPIAMADIAWTIAPTARLNLGYQHDFRDSMWGDYFMLDTAYLTYRQQIISRIDLSATARWIMANYSGLYLPSGFEGPGCTADNQECERTDHGIQLALSGGYHFTEWAYVGVGYTMYANMTDFYTEYDSPIHGRVQSPAGYVKHIAYLHADFSY